MTPNIDEFWKLIADSKLLTEQQLADAQDRFSGRNPAEICQQLVEETLFSPLHRDVILAGHCGPFVYGRYLVTKPLDSTDDAAGGWRSFAGKDLRTQHPVQLTFFSCHHSHPMAKPAGEDGDAAGDAAGEVTEGVTGRDVQAVDRWKQVEKRVRRLVKCRHGNLLQTYQTIVLPEYRFVVSELPVGVRLSETLPVKGRLKLDESASVALQVAQAIASQIDAGVDPCLAAPDRLMANIWVGKKQAKGTAKLAADFQCVAAQDDEDHSDPPPTPATSPVAGHPQVHSTSPQYAVVSLLMRLAGGAFADDRNLLKLIEKSGMTGELKAIVIATLGRSQAAGIAPDAAQAADQGREFKRLIEVLQAVSGDAVPVEKLATTDAFRKVLSGSQLHLSSFSKPTGEVPEIDPQVAPSVDQPTDDRRVLAARQAAALRRKTRWKTPVAVVATLLVMVTALGIWSLSPSKVVAVRSPDLKSTVQGSGAVAVAAAKSGPGLDSPTTTTTNQADGGGAQTADVGVERTDFSNVAYVQEIVEDDVRRLWESPTAGPAIDLRYVPNTTEILLHLRVSDLQRTDAGGRLLQGLSKTFATAAQRLQQSIGVAIEKIQTITVAWYPETDGRYQCVFIVTVGGDVSVGQLVTLWGNPDKVKTKDGHTIYSADQWVYLILENHDGTDNGEVGFVAGPAPQVQAMAMRGGISILSRPLQRLAKRTDGDRHVTLLTSPKALTDRFGRTLWGAASDRIVPSLQLFFPDEIRGFSLGVHIDQGDYLELQIEHSPDISARSLAEKLAKEVPRWIGGVAAFAASLPSVEYWNTVRQRIDLMTARLVEPLRWDVEFGQVVANAWLPPDATHNLVAASELTLAFADSVAAESLVANRRSPQTIEELLATPRSLNLANPPDLNILLTQLADDINDDFPDMPFQLKISLLGNDLQKEGITQNQRPGALRFENLTLAEMLTQIMVSANPDKNISGPADPECKLVWVVDEDVDEDVRRIAITTRAAAEGRGDVLPPAFTATVK